MKIKTFISIMSLAFVFTSGTAWGDGKAPEIKEHKHGVYVQDIRFVKRQIQLIYRVHTKTHLCFAQRLSDQVIPCENLALRDEWKSIITWVKDDSSE